MAGTLYDSSQLDKDGRQYVLDDNITNVHYYSSRSENWDKTGSAGQSWYLENFRPNDSFDYDELSSDRWAVVSSATISGSSITPTGSAVRAALERSEGTSALTSDGKWRLQGDFDLRLYIDWDSYYNEYRSISSVFLKVGYDLSNAVRLAFTFDGDSGYELRSEKVVDRSLRFFDWLSNGDKLDLSSFAATNNYLYFRIVREDGVISTYYSNGISQVQVGDSLSDVIFSEDLFVEFGVESKEYNTCRISFDKFFLLSGTITPAQEFFSTNRGRRQDFPESAIILVDSNSLSIIDEDTSTLWMRLNLDGTGAVPTSQTKVHACNGVVYCTTDDGVIAVDFNLDKIFRYRSSTISVADEPIALRNAGVVFRTYAASVGTIPNNNINDVYCRTVGGQDYLAFSHDSGVSVMRPLSSGVANCTNGPLPAGEVEISEKGSLYWAGYDSTNNEGELSYYSNVTALSGPGTTTFNRTGYYGTDTTLPIFGEIINSFSVATNNSTDLIAVGTTEGITFLSFSPGFSFTGSVSYGVQAPAENPFQDPSFEDYLGIYWRPYYTGFHDLFDLRRMTTFVTDGEYGLRFKFKELGDDPKLQADEKLGVYQDVNLTGIERIYYDIQMDPTSDFSATTNMWNFEVLVNDTVVRSHRDIDGPFTKYNDSANVVDFSGNCRVKFQIRNLNTINLVNMGQRAIYLDNIKTKIGDPDYRVLPPGNASIVEVLLQFDSSGKKIYFSSAEGYGAIDLVNNSLDYFVNLEVFGPDGSEAISGDFSRVTNEI